MRILHVLAPGPSVAWNAYVQLLALGQIGAGEEVHVAAVLEPATARHPLLETLAAGGVITHPWSLLAALLAVSGPPWRSLPTRLRPDVVHTHGYRPDLVDAGAARVWAFLRSRPLTLYWRRLENRLYERLQTTRLPGCSMGGRGLGAGLIGSFRKGVSPQRVHFVQNACKNHTATGIARPRAPCIDFTEDGFVIGWVGALGRREGAGRSVDAVTHLTVLRPTRHRIHGGRWSESTARVERLDARRFAPIERRGPVHWTNPACVHSASPCRVSSHHRAMDPVKNG